jgi:beta-phosphoglucomutase-like phosphatase (HAD superfamily)
MNYKAVLFGSIGTLIETSDLQRQAFNQAFYESDLNWNWSPEEYKLLLTNSGGQNRIQNYAKLNGMNVNAKALHDKKTEIFNKLMVKENISLRPGVSDIVNYAKNNNLPIAFVTSTSAQNINIVFDAIIRELKRSDFSFIGNDSMVSRPKPNPDIYIKALSELNLDAKDCIAIEDTEVSMEAAISINISCIGFPGKYSQENDFKGAINVTNKLLVNDLLN